MKDICDEDKVFAPISVRAGRFNAEKQAMSEEEADNADDEGVTAAIFTTAEMGGAQFRAKMDPEK